MKKTRYKSKVIKQILLYAFELISTSLLLTWLSTFISRCCTPWEYVERFFICYAVYQILVTIILNTINDIEKDSCLAYITNLKKAILYRDTNNIKIKENIINNIEYQLDSKTLNSSELIYAYKQLKKYLNNPASFDRSVVESELINAEHKYEFISLQWRYSFLCRLFK